MSTQIGDMEEFAVGVFVLLVNLLLVWSFRYYLAAALAKAYLYAKPINVLGTFAVGTVETLLPINIK